MKKMMKCKYCGKEIDTGSIFCGYCGKEQPKVKYCIKCGQEIGLDDAFCGFCGASQNVEKKIASAVNEKQGKQEEHQKPLETPVVETAQNAEKEKTDVDNSEQKVQVIPPVPTTNIIEKEKNSEEVASKPQQLTHKNNMLLFMLVAVILVLAVGLVITLSSKDGSASKSQETLVVNEERHNDEGESISKEEIKQDNDDGETQYDFVCEREVTANDLIGLDVEELRIMRNWIYARHGYIFKSQDLKEYFGQFSWYWPRYTDVSAMLSKLEKKNVEFIKLYE